MPDSGDSATRTRVIEAAVACILERGFYRASSNEIARRAGVTWGVIQHHFGTREELLLAVLRHDFGRFIERLGRAEIEGETTAERLASLAELVWSYYGRPEYVATMQIQLNLSRDPQCMQGTIDAMIELQERLRDEWARLASRSAAGGAPLPPALARSVLRVFRGMAIGEAIAFHGPDEVVARMPSSIDERRADRMIVIEALARSVDATLASHP
ncbi:MAG TPA: TetR/AcrR family transcriptional regulator [Acidimicrobiales bacterium]